MFETYMLEFLEFQVARFRVLGLGYDKRNKHQRNP
jgi:hypothetical protein